MAYVITAPCAKSLHLWWNVRCTPFKLQKERSGVCEVYYKWPSHHRILSFRNTERAFTMSLSFAALFHLERLGALGRAAQGRDIETSY